MAAAAVARRSGQPRRQGAVIMAFPRMPSYLKKHAGIRYTRNEWMAECFLRGYDEKVGAPLHWYVKYSYLSGSNEKLGREALICLLKKNKPLHPDLRRYLIDLFSDNPPSWVDRKLVIKFRSRQRLHKTARHLIIADYVDKQLRKAPRKKQKLEAAVEAATRTFGLSRTAIFQAMAKVKKEHPELIVGNGLFF
jgi:hypothetical protein